MTKFSCAECADARARNEAAALAIAACAGWRLERPPHLPRRVSLKMFYIAEPELLLAPLQQPGGLSSGPIDYAMRAARSDSLVIGAGSVDGQPTSIYATVGLWSRTDTVWYTDLRFWCSPCDGLWAASEPHTPGQLEVAFPLGGTRLRPRGLPWTTEAGRDMGFARADDLLLRSRENG